MREKVEHALSSWEQVKHQQGCRSIVCVMKYTLLVVFIAIFALNIAVVLSAGGCNRKNFEKCSCGVVDYLGSQRFVLNCTDVGFTNSSILGTLPEETEVLIFVGNNFDDLPWNVFGSSDNSNRKLDVVDLSNNNIRAVKGKTFHHVRTVTRLILNHNKINIEASREHPRIFSNFENLKELHLTDAFEEPSAEQFAVDLQEIFKNGNLAKLEKLHLEQNKIPGFESAPRIFCELPSLTDIYLGDNNLKHVNMDYDCLNHLRFIDFRRNKITELSENDKHLLNAFPRRNQNLTIDLSGNPFTCDKIDDLFKWIDTGKVKVRNVDLIHCTTNKTRLSCPKLEAAPSGSSNGGLVAFLSIALLVSLGLLVYTNREPIRTAVYPTLLSLSKNIHYTTIGRQEAQEMDVNQVVFHTTRKFTKTNLNHSGAVSFITTVSVSTTAFAWSLGRHYKRFLLYLEIDSE